MNKRSPVMAMVWMLAGMATAAAQTYPSHPVTMIVPFAAGVPWIRMHELWRMAWALREANPSSSKTSSGRGQHRCWTSGPRRTGRFHDQLWRLADDVERRRLFSFL